MEFRGEDIWQRGLREYIRLVADTLALTGDEYHVQPNPPADAYLALHGSLASFPDRDAALIWDEDHGWALAVEARCGEDLIVTGYFGDDIVPPPLSVAQFVWRSCDGAGLAAFEPPTSSERETVLVRLAAYAEPVLSSLPRRPRPGVVTESVLIPGREKV